MGQAASTSSPAQQGASRTSGGYVVKKQWLPPYSTITRHPEGTVLRGPATGNKDDPFSNGTLYLYQPSVKRLKRKNLDGAVVVVSGSKSKEKGQILYFLREGNIPKSMREPN